MTIEGRDLALRARDILDDKKGIDIVLLDVRNLSSVTDYYVICSGTSTPHIKALAQDVDVTLKHEDNPCFKKSGTAESGWMIIDYVDVVVHVFSGEAREYYDLERLWKDAVRVGEAETSNSGA